MKYNGYIKWSLRTGKGIPTRQLSSFLWWVTGYWMDFDRALKVTWAKHRDQLYQNIFKKNPMRGILKRYYG